MPNYKANLVLLKACLRKRPFDSEEAAESLNPADFDVYHCRFCNKWHRTSKPHIKQSLAAAKKQSKQRRKRMALKRRAIFKYYEQ